MSYEIGISLGFREGQELAARMQAMGYALNKADKVPLDAAIAPRLWIDASHPCEAGSSQKLYTAATSLGIDYLRYARPAWTPTEDDTWFSVRSGTELYEFIARRPEWDRLFLTSGIESLHNLTPLGELRQFYIRSRRNDCVPETMRHVMPKARILSEPGPYTVEGESALMREHRIKAIITKNAGGKGPQPKIIAARELGIPVLMIERPAPPPAPYFECADALLEWLSIHHPPA